MSRTISAGYVYRQYSTEGVYIADYKSSRAAHEATGVSIGSIARAAHGERRTGGGYVWRSLSCALSGAQKTAGGYIWEEKMEDDMQVQEQ